MTHCPERPNAGRVSGPVVPSSIDIGLRSTLFHSHNVEPVLPLEISRAAAW